jgi:hypothetical protein
MFTKTHFIGTAVNREQSGRDKATHDIVVKHFNSITGKCNEGCLDNPELSLQFGPADDFVAFGENKMLLLVKRWFTITSSLVLHQCPGPIPKKSKLNV